MKGITLFILKQSKQKMIKLNGDLLKTITSLEVAKYIQRYCFKHR